MKKITIILATLLLTSCFSGPEFVPRTYKDSPMSTALMNEAISKNKDTNYFWLFWYGPIAAIALLWAYKEFVKKKDRKDGN